MSEASGLFKKACPEPCEGFVQACPEPCRRKGRSQFCARSVLPVREHGKLVRTPLAAFFNSPILQGCGTGGPNLLLKPAPVSKISFLATSKIYFPRVLGLSGLLAVALEEGHVDPVAFVGVVKADDVGFVKEVGIEDDRPVLAVRTSNRCGPGFL